MKQKLFLAFTLVILLLGLAFSGLAGVQAAPLLTRGSLTATDLTPSGSTVSLSTANGDGHKFTNTNNEFVMVTNDYTATITMTIVTGGDIGGYDIDDVDVAVSASNSVLAGPFPTHIFNQTSGSDAGKVYLNWNATVTGTVANSVTVGVYKLD